MKTLRKVLVVDDDPVVGKSFHRVLSSRGYAVVTANDGPEALRKIAAEEYDLVYTDIRMPGMDGVAVAERIRERQPWLPVVIVSGYATAENEARAMAAGVRAVLHKPLSPEMIEDSARDALMGGRDEDAATDVLPSFEFPAAPAEPEAAEFSRGKRLAIVLGAPFLAAGYVLVLPFAGLAAMVGIPAWHGGRALARRVVPKRAWYKDVALLLAAPLLGLLYVSVMPFVGLGMLAWMGVTAVAQSAAS